MIRFVMMYLYFQKTLNALPVHLCRQVLVDFDGFWEPLGTNFGFILTTFFVIWTTQLQCGFQSGFFSDLGVDMAPGCDARMC